MSRFNPYWKPKNTSIHEYWNQQNKDLYGKTTGERMQEQQNEVIWGDKDGYDFNFDRDIAFWDPSTSLKTTDPGRYMEPKQSPYAPGDTWDMFQEKKAADAAAAAQANQADPPSRWQLIQRTLGQYTPAILDAANIGSQYAFINKQANQKRGLKPFTQRTLQLDVRPVQGLDQSVKDMAEQRINKMRNPSASSDAATNLAGNLSTAFQRDQARSELEARDAATIQQDKIRFGQEMNQNLQRAYDTDVANEKARHASYLNDRAANEWETGQYRQLTQDALDQLSDNAVKRGKYNAQAYQNKLNRQHGELVEQRDWYQYQLTQGDLDGATKITYQNKITELDKSIKSLVAREDPTMGQVYGSIYNSEIYPRGAPEDWETGT